MNNITGLHIYYYKVCKRKLWYFLKDFHPEEENESVMIGKIIDENSYSRDNKHIDILGYANIDSIHNNIIRETKKSNSFEDASIWQMKYYLYILKKHGMDDIEGEICYPTLKQKTSVLLNENDEAEVIRMEKEIRNLNNAQIPPCENKKNVCRKCAYYDLCMI